MMSATFQFALPQIQNGRSFLSLLVLFAFINSLKGIHANFLVILL